MDSTIVNALEDHIPPDAVVLRGYLAAAEAGSPRRIYLSARLNQWIEFHRDDLLHSVDPPDNDDTTIIWLNAEPTVGRVYQLVTVTPLDSETGFVRGQLLDDFLSEPEAQSAWDEQAAGSTRARSTFHCAA